MFSTRRKVNASPVSQTENAIQNIILQQMEVLQGILVATTNLTVNLDPAFERRFLYKLKFPPPGYEERLMIWQSKLPMVPSETLKALASRHPITGGNIDNIARKATMNEVLRGELPDLHKLDAWCREEILDKDQKPNIGFKA